MLLCSSEDGLQRTVHITLRRGPVRDRDAHRGHLVPGRPTEPRGAVFLDGTDDGTRARIAARGIFSIEADKYLIEHHVVQHPDAVLCRKPARKAAREPAGL